MQEPSLQGPEVKQICPDCQRLICSSGKRGFQAQYHAGLARCRDCHNRLLSRIAEASRALARVLKQLPEGASLEECKERAALVSKRLEEAEGIGVADEDLLLKARLAYNALDDRVQVLEAARRSKGEEDARARWASELEAKRKRLEEEARQRDEAERAAEQARFRDTMADAQKRDAPPWVTDEEFPGSLQGPVRVEDTACRGVSLGQILALADYIKHCLQGYNIVDTDERSPAKGQRLRWESLTMYQVCTYFVMPMTREEKCSYVELVGEGEAPPMWMTSHWWGTTFAHTVSMLRCHAQARHGGGDTHRPEEATYWICTLANNQHDLSSELGEDDMMKTPFVRAMLESSCQGTVLLCDAGVQVLGRAWCILEVHITEQLRRMPAWAPEAVKATDGVHFLDVVAPVAAADLPEGLEEPDGGCAAMLFDAGEGGWHERSTLPEVHFPLKVAQNGVLVNMCSCRASVAEDWKLIMNFIAYKNMSRQTPPAMHSEYIKLNLFIHEVFLSAELFRLCLEMPEDAVKEAERLVTLGADPNKFMRGGNTPLFAAVGADPLHTHDGGTDKAIQEQLVRFLLDTKANPNMANNAMATALDCAREANIEKIIREQGGKTFTEMAPGLEKEMNKKLKGVLKWGCGTLSVFSGSGGGAFANRLSAEAQKSLQGAAALLQQYPGAPCSIRIRWSTIGKARAELEGKARAKAVQAVLEGAGCRNYFTLETISKQSAPAVSLRIDLLRMDKIKNLGGALLMRVDTAGAGSSSSDSSDDVELDAHPLRRNSQGGSEHEEARSDLGDRDALQRRPSSVASAANMRSGQSGPFRRTSSVGSIGSPRMLDRRPDMDKVMAIFRKCDTDNTGTISREELGRLLLQIKSDLTQEQLDVMFQCADVDGDGEINYTEFLTWLDTSDLDDEDMDLGSRAMTL